MTFEKLLFVFWVTKSHFNVLEAENAACGDFVEGKQAHEPKAKTTWRHETISPPPVRPSSSRGESYTSRELCVCNSPAILRLNRRGETHRGKLTRLTCTKLKSHKASVFSRTSSLFHFPWQVNSTILFDYKPCAHAL